MYKGLFELLHQERLQLFNVTIAVQKDEVGVILSNEQNDFIIADAAQMEEIEELRANICMMARIQQANSDSDGGLNYDSAFISKIQTPPTNFMNLLFSKSNHEQRYHEQPKIVNSTIGDNQINSDIIFDDLNIEVNDGSVEYDKNVHDSHDNELEQLATNAYKEAEKQHILAIKVKEQNVELTKQLEQYKERVRVFETTNANKTNFHKNTSRLIIDQNGLKMIFKLNLFKVEIKLELWKKKDDLQVNVLEQRKQKAISRNLKLYDVSYLHTSKVHVNVCDIEKILDDATKSRIKMENKLKDLIAIEKKQNFRPIDYGKLNDLYEKFVPQVEVSHEQTYFSKASTSFGTPTNSQKEINELVENVSQKTYAQNQDTLITISELKAKLKNAEKGQFCDGDLEVAFRSKTCYAHNLEGDDLLKGARESNLYMISILDMEKANLPHKLIPSTHSKLELIHMDLCRSMRVESINGKKYVLVIFDEYSRYTWKVRADNGSEFKNATLQAHYEKLRIMQQFLIARKPQQNSVVKRRNRTLVEAARAMLIFSKAPEFLWAEAISTACFTQNRSLIHTRSLCYLTSDREDLGKMKPQAYIGIFIGYSKTSKGFWIYNRRTRKIMETIHVKFDELTAMASEHNCLEPETHCFNNDDSSAEFTSISSKEDLDNLFGPILLVSCPLISFALILPELFVTSHGGSVWMHPSSSAFSFHAAEEKVDSTPDMCDNDIQIGQNDVECNDERVALANLILNLKLDVEENKKIQKQLKKANTSLANELKECKYILAETSRTLRESNSIRDSCLISLQNKKTEFERYKTFNDRTANYDKLEHLKAQLQDKNIAISELKKLIEKIKGKSVDTNFKNSRLRNQSKINQWYSPKHVSFQSPRESIGSNDMVHNYYLEEAKKKEQLQKDKALNTKPRVQQSARLPNTTNGNKPKPRNFNQQPRNWPPSMSSSVSNRTVNIVEPSRNPNPFLKSKDRACLTCKKCIYSANHDECILKYLKKVAVCSSLQLLKPKYKRRCCSLIPAKSNSKPHAYAQTTNTYYKHQDSSIKKAQVLKTKISANSNIKENSLETKLHGRLLESFQEDAKYEYVGQDTRSQKDKGSRSKITQHEGTSLQHNKDCKILDHDW
nr:hypothetical protein [Tanacetum cinerariifolium]